MFQSSLDEVADSDLDSELDSELARMYPPPPPRLE